MLPPHNVPWSPFSHTQRSIRTLCAAVDPLGKALVQEEWGSFVLINVVLNQVVMHYLPSGNYPLDHVRMIGGVLLGADRAQLHRTGATMRESRQLTRGANRAGYVINERFVVDSRHLY